MNCRTKGGTLVDDLLLRGGDNVRSDAFWNELGDSRDGSPSKLRTQASHHLLQIVRAWLAAAREAENACAE
jgi:hypothetical protein